MYGFEPEVQGNLGTLTNTNECYAHIRGRGYLLNQSRHRPGGTRELLG